MKFSDKENKTVYLKLNSEFSDSGFSHVSELGGGSSFDGTNFDGNNSQMKVLNRYEQLSPAESNLLSSILDKSGIESIVAELDNHHDHLKLKTH